MSHTIQDEKTINEYENYIARHGVDRSLLDAYVEASRIILTGRKDAKYGLKVSSRAKSLIEDYVLKKTGGYTMDDLELLAFENEVNYHELDKYYDVIESESPYLVDSFFKYIEIDERDPYKRFYFP